MREREVSIVVVHRLGYADDLRSFVRWLSWVEKGMGGRTTCV